MQTGLPLQRNISSIPANAEYTIYAYEHLDDGELDRDRWQRVTISRDPSDALLKAERLFLSQQYRKIEIKKKAFNDKKGQHVASTFRVFENKPNQSYLTLAAVLLLAISSVGLFYL